MDTHVSVSPVWMRWTIVMILKDCSLLHLQSLPLYGVRTVLLSCIPVLLLFSSLQPLLFSLIISIPSAAYKQGCIPSLPVWLGTDGTGNGVIVWAALVTIQCRLGASPTTE